MMDKIDKLQEKIVHEYTGIKNGYISEQARQKARAKRKKKKHNRP